MTNFHKLRGLKQWEFVLIPLEARRPKGRCSPGLHPLKAPGKSSSHLFRLQVAPGVLSACGCSSLCLSLLWLLSVCLSLNPLSAFITRMPVIGFRTQPTSRITQAALAAPRAQGHTQGGW